jgi:group I intron endonuclease
MKNNLKPEENVNCGITTEITKEPKENVWNDTGKIKRKVSGIYKIINKVNGKYYVGSSNDIEGIGGRWYNHKYHLKKKNHKNYHLQNAWNKYGEGVFDFITIEECSPDFQILTSTEQKYLDIAKNEKCYNTCFIAGRVEMTEEIKNKIRNRILGLKRSNETKQRISRSKIGNKNCLGRKMTDITKQRIADKVRGNKNCLGHKASKNTKLKLSLAHIGKNTREKNSSFDKTIYHFINKLTSEEFLGLRLDFYTKYFLDTRCVSSLIKRRLKSYKGWILN